MLRMPHGTTPPAPSTRRKPICRSTLWRKYDAEQHPFVRAYLPGRADVSTTVRRDHVVDLVVGNWRPFAVHLDFVMVPTMRLCVGRQSKRLQQVPLPSFLLSFK